MLSRGILMASSLALCCMPFGWLRAAEENPPTAGPPPATAANAAPANKLLLSLPNPADYPHVHNLL